MKIETTIEKIKNALITVERMTGKNLTLPVLSSVLFIVSDKNLILRSTNLSIGIEIKIPVKVEKEGVVAIRGDILSSIFSTISNDSTIIFEQKDSNINIKTKNNNFTLKTIPYEDFPTLPVVEGDSCLIPSKKLVEGFKSVFYSSALSDIKPEIGSVYIYPENDNLVFVATDSFRLAEKKVKIKQNLSFNGILIPFKNTVEILRVLENVNEDITLVFNKNQASISFAGTYITTRVIDGVFPDYKQIIPKQTTTEITLLKQDLLNALKVSNIFSDKFNQITLFVDPKDKKIELKSKNNDIGENVTQVQAVLKGENVEANFNYKYILDSFQSMNSDSITLELTGNNKAMIIKAIGDQSFLYLVMPMNR